MAKKNKTNDDVEFDLIDSTGTGSPSNFIEENKNTIFGIFAVLLLVVGGYMAYQFMVIAPKEKEAVAQMYKAEIQFSRDSFALALENPGGGFEGFLEIIDNYSGTKTANTAKFYAGISYLNMGRFEDAIEYLNDFSPAGDILPISKEGALGDAYSELGEMDKAVSYYKNAGGYSNEVLAPYYLNKLALLQQNQSNNAGAVSTYQMIVDKFPSSTEAKDAEKYILRLK